MEKILHINDRYTELDSGLSEQEFARSRLGQYMSEAGVLCIPEKGGGFKTEEFRFTETKRSETGTVLLCAASFKGKNLLTLVQNAMTDTETRTKSDALQAICAVSRAAEFLMQSNELTNCGPAGIIVGEKNEVLFLPPSLFERSMLSRNGKERALLYGSWMHTALDKTASMRFTLSACIYAVLAGKPPFAEEDEEKRNEDYCDNNFIPLKYFIFLVDENTKKFVEAIDANLSTGFQIRQRDKKRTQTSVQLVQSFSLSGFETVVPVLLKRTGNTEQYKALTEQRNAFYANRQKTLRKQRFLRKHGVKLGIAALMLLAVSISVLSIVRTNRQRPSTENMSAVEVVQTFYSALSRLDSLTLDSCGKRKALKTYSNMTATLFVTGKMRQAYENTLSFLPPEQWFNTHNPLRFYVFGLTQLTVTGENPAAYAFAAKKGDTTEVTARFFIFADEGQNTYRLTSYTDRLTLIYGKKYWQIHEISSESKDEDLDSVLFVQAVTDMLAAEASDKNAVTAAQRAAGIEKLKNVYPWLPSAADMKRGLSEMPDYVRLP